MIEGVEFQEHPQLQHPQLVAAWPGIGQVALTGARYLCQGLGAEELARLDPLPYFELGGVIIEDNLIQPSRFPKNTFYYWQSPQGAQDLIIFEAEAQPSYDAYRLAHKMLDIARHFGVSRIFTFAAALVSELPAKPRVWAAATSSPLGQELNRWGAMLQGDFYIAGMNGVLLAVAKERGVEAACLLGETLRLIPQQENPAASLAVLEVLTPFLGLPLNLEPLRQRAKEAQQELERLLMESRKEFLDRFTVPMWEKGDEEEKA